LSYQSTPPQKRFNDPFTQELYQFNTPHSNISYLSNPINTLSEIIGNNIVTNKLNVNSASISNNLVTITISEGTCIVDNVFHKITSPTTLTLDVSGYDASNGKLVVSAHYAFYQTTQDNPLKFKLSYVSNDGTVVLPVGWKNGVDNLIVAAFTYDNTTNTITELDTGTSITINGNSYLVKGYDGSTTSNIRQFIGDITSYSDLVVDFGTY
jgi:hypothetical protein